MTTAGEVIRDALSELTVQAQEQTVPAVDLQTGIRYLNRMMAAWSAVGIKLGYTVVSSSNDVLTIPAGAEDGVVFNLAVRLASGFDVMVSPSLVEEASVGKNACRVLGLKVGKMKFSGNLPMGSGNEGAGGAYDTSAFFPDCCEDQNEC